MTFLPQIVSVLLAAVAGIFMGASFAGLAGFILIGLIAGFTAQAMAPGSERIYWIAVSVIILMILLSYFGFDINGFIFVTPALFALTYFAARLVMKVTGQRAEAS